MCMKHFPSPPSHSLPSRGEFTATFLSGVISLIDKESDWGLSQARYVKDRKVWADGATWLGSRKIMFVLRSTFNDDTSV